MMNNITGKRLIAIDALRGVVMLLMLLDHVRETFYLHHQLTDPVNVSETSPALFASRLLSHLCAPIFVFLTGLSAALYQQKVKDVKKTSLFLLKRGCVLILMEITVVNFAWTFQIPPENLYLQVIWVIGLSMIALAGLIHFQRAVLMVLSVAVIAGHNLLDAMHFSPETWQGVLWAVIHDRVWINMMDVVNIRTSYPVLPWLGVISLGFLTGRVFLCHVTIESRTKKLLRYSGVLFLSFWVLRLLNVYGDTPWHHGGNITETLISYFNVTKYPPSLQFICLTLSVGLVLLVLFERVQNNSTINNLSLFGAAPMFFYLLHLYVLKLVYQFCVTTWGLNYGKWFGFESVWMLWVCAAALAGILYFPVCRFAQLKARRRDLTWLKYF